jgi:tRNA G37 N-methylase Trm5
MKGVRWLGLAVFMLPTTLLLVGLISPAAGQSAGKGKTDREPDVPFVPTPFQIVDRMLKLADVRKGDVVYDLGCGDGRILVAAAKKYGARGFGFDIDPERVQDSLENIKINDVENLVAIKQADIFTLDLSGASVITLYLLPQLNVKLLPQLEKLKPGVRIVSHAFDMRNIKPKRVEIVRLPGNVTRPIYLWVTPLEREKVK